MPEVLEVELTRRGVASIVGRTITAVERTDDLVVGPGVDAVAPDALIESLSRRGKQLVIETDHGAVGVHLGMTGRLLIDDADALGRLTYGSRDENPVWDRWVVRLDDGRRLRLHDPRRLGRITLDPDVDRLGPDALELTRRQLATALAERSAPLKAVLLNQQRIAGLGNMLVDEVLWRSGLAPDRPARSLTADEVTRLHRTIKRRLPAMMAAGGSHTGTISSSFRSQGGPCPRCGAEMRRATIGTRTTWWCPVHQV